MKSPVGMFTDDENKSILAATFLIDDTQSVRKAFPVINIHKWISISLNDESCNVRSPHLKGCTAGC